MAAIRRVINIGHFGLQAISSLVVNIPPVSHELLEISLPVGQLIQLNVGMLGHEYCISSQMATFFRFNKCKNNP